MTRAYRLPTLAISLISIYLLSNIAAAQPQTAQKPASGNAAPAGASTAPAPPAPATSGFQGSADLPNAVQIAFGVSPDNQAATVLFRNLDAQVLGKFGTNAGSRVQTLVIPLANNGSTPLHISQDIRGFVSVTGKSRAVLIVQAGGVTSVVDLDKARLDPKAATPTAASPSVSAAKNSAAQKAKDLPASKARASVGDSFNFSKRLEADIAPGAAYQVTFFLLAERDVASDDSAGLITIDSLDVEIAQTPVAPSKK